MYQRRLARVYNKKVRTVSHPLKHGDLVLKIVRAMYTDPRGKLHPNWEDTPSIMKVIQNVAAKAKDTDGNTFTNPVDIDKLKVLLKSTR